MAYIPKNWAAGDIITEQALDHIEQGIAAIGGGIVLLNVTTDEQDTKHLGKSYNEIVALIENGTIPIAVKTLEHGAKLFYELASIFPGETVGGTFYPYSVSFYCGWVMDDPNMDLSANTATEELTTGSQSQSGGSPIL